MPAIAVLHGKIITVADIYKEDIAKDSPFLCFTCDQPLRFRQSRTPDGSYTDHFYHPNIKDTHIECERNTLDRLRDNDTWHNKLSECIESQYREVIRTDGAKHIVDAYDSFNDMGIEFQHSPISVEAVQSRDATTYLHWVFNVENQFIRKVSIGNKIICQIPSESWENAVKAVKHNVYLYTGSTEWILLQDRESYRIEVEGRLLHVWIGEPCPFDKVYDDTCLQNIITQEGLTYFQELTKKLETVRTVYARCKRSMVLLDDIHRLYIKTHRFKPNEIVAIKSVAGSGKTTTLLSLASIHSKKKIVYLAFNKALITDIGLKLKKQGLQNVYPLTFDALVYGAYRRKYNRDPPMTDSFTPQSIYMAIPWLQGKPFKIRKYYVDLYSNFCKDADRHSPQEFARSELGEDKPLLTMLWNKTVSHELLTFDSLKKLALIGRWLKGYIDETYDMIMIDETQDFDGIMLKMLLNDTTIPKLFVGDPKQSIYQWRGCIDGFKSLPPTSLILEFYSTFRVGDPACEVIRAKFKHCWMISKSKETTTLTEDASALGDTPYTYLFRTWKKLLQRAQGMPSIWIHNCDHQIQTMRRRHAFLTENPFVTGNDEYDEDLSRFLKSMSKGELEDLISTIEQHSVPKESAKVKFYTIHAYKGLEDDVVRIGDDIDDKTGENENLYYVALTRGKKLIVEDTSLKPTQIQPKLEDYIFRSRLFTSL
jgi:hypothetical protein